MKVQNLAKGALLASALALSSLVSGCGSDGSNAQAELQRGSIQANPLTAGALQILLLNDFNSVPVPSANPQTQVTAISPITNAPVAGVNATRPTLLTVVDTNNNNVPAPPSIVSAGNLTLAVNDTGVFAPSGTTTNVTVNDGSLGNTVAGLASASSVVWTAISPDRKFAYEISGVQSFAQTVNVTPPSNLTALTPYAVLNYGVPANATLSVSTTNTSAPTFQRGFFGENRLTQFSVTEVGKFTTPPNPLPVINFDSASSTFYYGLYHPGGNFFYLFGDSFFEGQIPGATAGRPVLTPGNVALPAARDTAVLDISAPGATATSPQIQVVNGTTNVTFLATAISSGRTRAQRGFISTYAVNRQSGALTIIDNFWLPNGYASPRWASFGPNGADLYVSCYSVANTTAIAATNTSGVATKGGILHYRLQTGNVTNNQGTQATYTGILTDGTAGVVNNAGTAFIAGGPVPRVPAQAVETSLGALGHAFSQGYRHFYVACQLDGFTSAASLNGGNSTIPSAIGSVRGFDVDGAGNLTANAANDVGVGNFSYPGYLTANPVLDFLVVSNNGGRLNVQDNSNQSRSISAAAINGPSLSLFKINANGSLAAGSVPGTQRLTIQGSFQTVNFDPTGNLAFVCGGAAIPVYDFSGTSPGSNGIAESRAATQIGAISVHAFNPAGNGTIQIRGGTAMGTQLYPVSTDLYQVLPQAPTQ